MVRGLAWTALWLTHLISLMNAATATSVNVTAPIVDLGYAKYQGYFDTHTNITNFLSIRYASPPVGKLRFQAPQPPAFESGIQPATQNPDTCYQTPSGVNMTGPVPPYGNNKRAIPAASEDCLFLNVFVPGTMPSEPVTTGKLPVLVWIHGGGYGHGYAARNNGADLVADSLNTVIAVVLQYRLGAFGFLAGNETKAQGALNAGLLDQTFALQWVQDHIGQFGGNKNHVTVWGESAGAGSVLQHIVANGGNTQPPLFNAVMVSSTYLPPQYYYNDRLPELLYNEVVARTGCASNNNTFTCLQSVNETALQVVNYDIATAAFFGTFIFVPVIDGTIILERPTVTLARGQVNGQVLLAVNNQREGASFIDANETLTITDYISRLFPDMAYPQVQEVAHLYGMRGTIVEQAAAVIGDSIFVCPNYYLLDVFAGRSWKGYFAIPPADHADDIPYYFDSPSTPPPYDDATFIRAFSQSFISLARFYDVNVKFDPSNITPDWNKYDVARTEMLFNRTQASDAPVVEPVHTDPALVKRCEFWTTVTSMTWQ